jgi:hypothetical protein
MIPETNTGTVESTATQTQTPAATTAMATTTQPSDLKPLANDLQADIQLAMQVVKAMKAQGAVAGITANAAPIIAAVQQDIKDVEAALPAVKAGYKTTEFWMIAAFLGGNAVYVALTGKTLPIDFDAVTGTLIAIYTAFRNQAKKTATT